MNESLKERLVVAQQIELTEHYVYKALARMQKSPENRRILERIADDELRHSEFWAGKTKLRLGPDRMRLWRYKILARLLGLTFAVKLMERGEQEAEASYDEIVKELPDAQAVLDDEIRHEKELVALLDEERLRYVGSVVLGLSDALVELTGALAGLTLALQNSRLIAAIGLITGVAAAMSMAASEYLSSKADEGEGKVPAKSAFYTGSAYIVTVGVLIAPFMLLSNPIAALGLTVGAALMIILGFAYYVSVAKDLPLWRRFGEMAGLSLGVAAISFGIGYVVRTIFGVDV